VGEFSKRGTALNVVADTDAVIWYLMEPDLLSKTAYQALSEAGLIYVSAVSLVEIRCLIEKGAVTEAAFQQIIDFLNDPNVALTPVPLDLDVALILNQVPRKIVPDMPGRIIAATALHLGLSLVTRDEKIQALSLHTIW
jgi:PIN domain nuclease of toxin-antitoxin system